MSYANNKGADQPVHPRSLISTFVVHCLDSIISLDSIAEISRLYLASVAEQAGFVWPGRKLPKTRFVMTRLIYRPGFSSLVYMTSQIFSSLVCYTFSVLFFIPHHTKSGGVLCYTLRSLSFRPSVCLSALHFRALTLVPFDLFSSNFA